MTKKMFNIADNVSTIISGMEVEKKVRNSLQKWPICCQTKEGEGKKLVKKDCYARLCCGRSIARGNEKTKKEKEGRKKSPTPSGTRTHSVSQLQRDFSQEFGDERPSLEEQQS